MIDRYSLPEMSGLFTDETRFSVYLEVELAVSKILAHQGIIPMESFLMIKKNAQINLKRINELEQMLHHDVIAFTRAVCETLNEEKKWFHYRLTSTDVVDTAMSLIYQKANGLIEEKLDYFMNILKKIAYHYQMTPCIGRTHGIHAEITSFGLKFALYYDEFSRHKTRFNQVRKHIEVGKMSGAVGNHAHISPSIQDLICQELSLGSVNISTQVLQRDRHAEYMSVLALIASSLEKIATEIRHLQRTEVNEASERFTQTQKGSSAMPHKKNPIASENLSGCARLMRGYLTSAFENIVLWHERDISHSSVERVIFPDALSLLHYMLDRYAKVLDSLEVFEQNMLDNIQKTNGVIYSQVVLNALIDKGISRDDAYDIIQPIAFKAINQKENFLVLLQQHKTVQSKLSNEELEQCFSPQYYLNSVKLIYARVFKEDGS